MIVVKLSFRAQDDVLKSFVMSDKQSKTQRYLNWRETHKVYVF